VNSIDLMTMVQSPTGAGIFSQPSCPWWHEDQTWPPIQYKLEASSPVTKQLEHEAEYTLPSGIKV